MPRPFQRRILPLFVFPALALLAACATSPAVSADAGTDAALAPDTNSDAGPRDAAVVIEHCIPEMIPADGFTADVVVVETSHATCSTGACMVYRLVGNPNCVRFQDARCATPATNECWSSTGDDLCVDIESPAEVEFSPRSPDRAFCTCRCSAAGDPSLPLCTCQPGYRCLPDTEATGGYCVPSLILINDSICDSDADCALIDDTRHCNAVHHCE